MTTACSLLTAMALAAPAPAAQRPAAPSALRVEPFGALTVYRPAGTPTGVVLFASGDGGWNLGVVGMAERLRARGALVVGFDVRAYFRATGSAPGCRYAAADFEALSQRVQREVGLDHYIPPVLAGYSSGATLAYLALAESPRGTFQGGISLGFCADLPGGRAWCAGPGGLRATRGRKEEWIFEPATQLPAPWIVLQGEDDQVCPIAGAAAFVARTGGAELVRLPRVGHGFAVTARWGDAFDQAYLRLSRPAPAEAATPPGPVSDLPLVEVRGPEPPRPGTWMAVMLSGDGGWAGLDREVGERLASRGVPVVGLNSLAYFWAARSPERLAADLVRLLRYYFARWDRSRVLLLGYSFGADVLPFGVAALPQELRERVGGVGLIALSPEASFEFRVTDWLGRNRKDQWPTAAALAALPRLLEGAPVICLRGRDETTSGCRESPGISVVTLPGGHHFDGDYEAIVNRLYGLTAP